MNHASSCLTLFIRSSLCAFVNVCVLVTAYDLTHRQTHQQTAHRNRRYKIYCYSNASPQANDCLTRWRLVGLDTDHCKQLDRTTATFHEQMNSGWWSESGNPICQPSTDRQPNDHEVTGKQIKTDSDKVGLQTGSQVNATTDRCGIYLFISLLLDLYTAHMC